MIARILVLLTIALSSAALAGPEIQQPTGKWYVDFGDAQCIATRNYGTADDPLYLVLKMPPLGGVLQIGVVKSARSREAAYQVDGDVFFDNAQPIHTTLLEFGSSKLKQRVLLANVPVSQLDPMKRSSSIRIRSRGEEGPRLGTRLPTFYRTADYQLGITMIPQVLSTMENCAQTLRKAWNVQEENAPSLVKEDPVGDLRRAFSPGDYPDVAMMKNQSGSLKVAILVDEQGKIADCTVIKTSGVASLDAQSCAVAKQRAKFKPAIGLDGKPAKRAITQTIVWRLES